MQLRDYQISAVNACWDYISTKPGNPCIVLPTGAGKSLVLAQLAHDAATKWNGRVIILAHVKELLEQNRDKLKVLSPDLDIGVYSAGLNKRDRHSQVLVAGIQSVYDKATDFEPFDLIIVDEAHLIPPDGEGRYRTFLNDCKVIAPHVRLIGLTATPYRMQTGWVCEPENLLNEICFEVGVKQLIQDGWLSKLTSKEGLHVETSGLHIRGGEFIPEEAEKLMLDVVQPACREILAKTELRRSILVFCQSVEHADRVTRLLRDSCLCRVEMITGDTPNAQRAEWIRLFRHNQIKYLVNVNVLTTGFDAPNVDCICLLRPTMSPGLYYQMVGRGFRVSDGKENCLVLDFAGNIKRHGPIDQIQPKPRKAGDGSSEAPTKTCPECKEVCHAGFSICPDCGFQFEDRSNAKHDATAGTSPVTSLEVSRETFPVLDVRYFVHVKKSDPNGPKSLRVDYKVNPIKWHSEWVCVEHDGFARSKAVAWWRARSHDAVPEFAEDAKDLAEAGALAPTLEITVEDKPGEKFSRIVKCKIGEKPEKITSSDLDDFEFPVGEPNTTAREYTDDDIARVTFGKG